MLTRRVLLRSAFATALAAPILTPGDAARAAAQGLRFGARQPFSFELLTARAKRLAAADYRPPSRPAPDVVKRLDYEALGKIRVYDLFDEDDVAELAEELGEPWPAERRG